MDYDKINIFYPVIGFTGMVHSEYMMSTINLMSLCRQKNIKNTKSYISLKYQNLKWIQTKIFTN